MKTRGFMILTRLLAALCLLACTSLWAGWVDGTNPVFAPSGGAYYPCVLYDAASFSGYGAPYRYKMWYTDHSVPNYQIGLAGSNDGTNWTVLADPISGSLALPHHIQVLYDPGGFGGSGYFYRMWYWAQSGDLYSISAIHAAFSQDGVNWSNDQAITQVGTSVVIDNGTNWNRGSYGPIALIYNSLGSSTLDDTYIFNNRYVMYYDGTDGSQEAWGLAYSTDGLLWKGYNGGIAPVLPVGTAGAWDDHYAAHGSLVHNPGGVWELWYGGGKSSSSEGIGHATSADGIVWTKDPSNPLTALGCPTADPPTALGCPGSWNAERNYTPVVLPWPYGNTCPAQILKMWRSGKSETGAYSIGYAEMTLPAPSVRNVPADYATIQSAIDAAVAGDTVEVAAGSYPEKLMITKPLALHSTSGAASTIVHGPSGEPYVVFITATCVTLDGFTITSPEYAGGSDASGVVVEPTQPSAQIRITNCLIHDIGTPDRTSVTFGNVGINVGMADGVEIDHDQIYNIIHNCPTAWANGICVWGNDDTHRASNINIHDNAIYNIASPYPVDACVSVQDYADNVTVFHNSLLSAGNYGAEVRDVHTTGMLASCNWWGDISGPTYSGNPGGTGSLITDYVTYSPWNDTDMSGTCGQVPATHLAFSTQPGSTVVDAALAGPPTVEIRDAVGNRVTRYTGPVTVAIGTNPSGGTLSGTKTVAAVAGRAPFGDLSIDNAGAGYTLTASSPGLAGATSGPFDIFCVTPAFDSAWAAPDNAGLGSQQTLTLHVLGGSAVPSSFAFTWDSAFTVRSFSADPDGILGFWQEMKPYSSPFIPSASYLVVRIDASTAFVDVNGNGTYEAGTDYDVALLGRTITVSRSVSGGAVESPAAGYRLILQDSLFMNPPSEGNYPVQAVVGSWCPATWTGSVNETTGPPNAGCPPGSLTRDIGDTVRVGRSGSQMTIFWDAVTTELCMTGYAVFASNDCTQWLGWAPITGQDLDMDPTNTHLTAGVGLNVTFYLVAEAGDGSQIGPLDHYGM